MNFFEQQDIARRNTFKLVVLMLLAVLSLIAAATALVAAVLFTQSDQGITGLDWQILAGIAVLVCTVVLLGSLYKLSQLRGGGHTVAEAMGGRLIQHQSGDADERKVLNVVEEMAIASGIPVPPVYILDDDSINAFAAGYSPQDAVIGVTRGCIRLLNRDELQGVMAHEFSHIFHGDMRLNMRLVAALNGILLLGLLGYLILRGGSARHMTRGSRRGRGGKGAGAILALGLGLIVIGYAGTFFGNLIKAAVSRQREFLADASAVQYTRNPNGIAGALKKIGGYAPGSKLDNAGAAEFSHMYFSQGVASAFSALMATHPPLSERIKRVEPRWDGTLPEVSPPAEDHNSEQTSGFAGASAAPTEAVPTAVGVERSIDAIGQPEAAHLTRARQTIAGLPAALKEAAHGPFAARALIYGLLLSEDPDVRHRQLAELETNAYAETFRALQQLLPQLSVLTPSQRLPLVELALPALKQLSPEQDRVFKQCLIQLIRADQRISLLEWSLYRIVRHSIEQPSHGLHHHNLRKLRNQCQLLMSVMARAGADDDRQATDAFKSAAATLHMSELTLLPREAIQLSQLDKALEELNRVKPLQKPQLLKALSQCVVHDNRVTPTEAELFRAIADSLDCPLPPILGSGEGTGQQV